jgi:serine/threonine protein kinase
MNIIRVLDHGWLTGSLDVYFIDMELGDFTLADYIDYIHDRRPNLSKAIIDSLVSSTNPAFVPGKCPVHERMENVMVIGNHIAQGLEFMHSLHHVHRDLKPSNGISPGLQVLIFLLQYSIAIELNCGSSLTSEYQQQQPQTGRTQRNTAEGRPVIELRKC